MHRAKPQTSTCHSKARGSTPAFGLTLHRMTLLPTDGPRIVHNATAAYSKVEMHRLGGQAQAKHNRLSCFVACGCVAELGYRHLTCPTRQTVLSSSTSHVVDSKRHMRRWALGPAAAKQLVWDAHEADHNYMGRLPFRICRLSEECKLDWCALQRFVVCLVSMDSAQEVNGDFGETFVYQAKQAR